MHTQVMYNGFGSLRGFRGRVCTPIICGLLRLATMIIMPPPYPPSLPVPQPDAPDHLLSAPPSLLPPSPLPPLAMPPSPLVPNLVPLSAAAAALLGVATWTGSWCIAYCSWSWRRGTHLRCPPQVPTSCATSMRRVVAGSMRVADAQMRAAIVSLTRATFVPQARMRAANNVHS